MATIEYPKVMQRTWCRRNIPTMDVRGWLLFREEYVRRNGDNERVWAILWAYEGLLEPPVRRALAAKGERI